MKTNEILEAYKVLQNAKYQKLSDDGKVKVWKITRLMKPVATQFKEDLQDAQQKLMPDGDFIQRLGKAMQYEQDKKNEKTPGITDGEYQAIVKEVNEYNQLVNKAVQEYSEKDVELEFEALSEEDFGKLMASNDWTMAEVGKIEFLAKE